MIAKPNYTAISMKLTWMVVLMAVSVYVIRADWDELNYEHLCGFKVLMFFINFLIYYSELYKLVCAIGAFVDIEDSTEDRDVFEAGTVNWGVAAMAFMFVLIWPVFLFKTVMEKKLVSFVMLLDYMQALIIIPLSFVTIFSADEDFNEVDILVNATATFIFSNLDDVFVEAFYSYDCMHKLKRLYFQPEPPAEIPGVPPAGTEGSAQARPAAPQHDMPKRYPSQFEIGV
jgi:hypothetical protein